MTLVSIWHVDLEGLVKDKDANEFVQLKGVENCLWWLRLVVEGGIAHNATLGAYVTNKFLESIQAKVIPTLNRQRLILMDNIPIHKSRENQQAFEDVGHIYSLSWL